MIAIPAAAAIPAAMIKIVADEIAAAVERGKRIGMNAPDHTSSRQPIHIAAGECSLAGKVASANPPVTHTNTSVAHTNTSVAHTNASVTHTNASVTHANASVAHTNASVTHANAPVTYSPINSAAAIEATGAATIETSGTTAIKSPSASTVKSTAASHATAATPAAIASKVPTTAAAATPSMTTTAPVGRAVARGDRTGQQQHYRQGDPADAPHPSDRGLPQLQAGVPGNTFKADGHRHFSTGNISVGMEHLRLACPLQRNWPPVQRRSASLFESLRLLEMDRLAIGQGATVKGAIDRLKRHRLRACWHQHLHPPRNLRRGAVGR